MKKREKTFEEIKLELMLEGTQKEMSKYRAISWVLQVILLIFGCVLYYLTI